MAETSAALSQADSISEAPFEHQLFMRSPFGTLATTVLVFLLLYGSFLILAVIAHVPIFGARVIAVSSAAWSALVLSLLCSAALGMQRYVRQREARDRPPYSRILSGGMQSAIYVTGVHVPDGRLGRATVMGTVVGLILSVIIRMVEFNEGHPIPLGPMIWFVFATTLLSVLFSRGVEQSRAGGRAYARLLDSELKIDLLRIDTLSVVGRTAARSALIWFVVSAIASLFFVGGDLNWLTIALIVGCGAMGIGVFVSILLRVHHKIVATKNLELEKIRRQIEVLRDSLHHDDGSASRLQGLLAYEKRIADAHEWPFDQTTLVRLTASAFILIVPWIGRAVADYLIGHFDRIAG